MERKLPIYKLTSGALFEGSRMMAELLSHDIAAQRARRTVAPPRPTPWISGESRCAPKRGYIQLVRFIPVHWLFALSSLPFPF